MKFIHVVILFLICFFSSCFGTFLSYGGPADISMGYGDDEAYLVKTNKSIKFWDKSSKLFYVSIVVSFCIYLFKSIKH